MDGIEWVRPANRMTHEATVMIDVGGQGVAAKAIILEREWKQAQDLRALKRTRLRLAIDAVVELMLEKIGA